MARCIQQIDMAKALTVSTQTAQVLNITNYSGASTTITCPAGAAGSMFYEWCNFNSTVDADWKAVNTTTWPQATVTLGASQSLTINVHSIHVGFVRVRVTLSAGAGNYNFYSLAKDF